MRHGSDEEKKFLSFFFEYFSSKISQQASYFFFSFASFNKSYEHSSFLSRSLISISSHSKFPFSFSRFSHSIIFSFYKSSFLSSGCGRAKLSSVLAALSSSACLIVFS